MMTRSPWARASWLLCAVVQLALPAAASMADAYIQVQTSHRVGLVHLESHSTQSCGRGHPDNCALCQYLSHQLIVGRRITLSVEHTDRPSSPLVGAVPSPLGARRRLPDSRAPPVLS